METRPVTIGGTKAQQVDLLPFGKPRQWARVMPLGKWWTPGRYIATFDPDALTCTMKRAAP